MYLMREIIDYSFPKIGAVFNKDHTTAIHSHKLVSKLMEEDLSVKINIEGLTNDIKGSIN